MRSKRPTPVLVIAIFHLIFGGLSLFCGLTSLVTRASGVNGMARAQAGETQQQKDMREMQVRVQQRTEREAPLGAAYFMVSGVLSYLMALTLIVIGLGLLKMQRWAWWGSVVYAAFCILYQICSLLFNSLYLLPIQGRIYDEELKRLPTLQPLVWFSHLIVPLAIFMVMLGFIYPTIVLIVMSRPKVLAAFRGKKARIDDSDRSDDFDDRRGRRRRQRDDEDDDEGRDYDDDPDDRFGPAR